MKHLLAQFEGVYPKPTQEMIEAAWEWLNDIGPGNTVQGIYAAKCEKTRKLQARGIAYGKMAGSSGLAKQAPAYTPEELEAKAIADAVAHDQAVTKRLMAGTVYEGISVNDPAKTRDTKSLKFLMEDFHYSGKHVALILGGVGCGKTYASVGYVGQQADVMPDNGINARFITGYELMQAIQQRNHILLDSLDRVKYLVVDDIGTHSGGYKGSDFVAHFEHLFNTRHLRQRHTIITGNITYQQFAETFGERVVSRLREVGRVFVSDEPDLRRAS